MITSDSVATTIRFRMAWAPIALSGVIALGSGCGHDGNSLPWASSRPPESDTTLEVGADRSPTTKTLYAMSRILAAKGRDVECEKLLRRVIHQRPRFLPAYCDLAALQLRHGRIDDAMDTLSSGREFAPGDPVLQNNLGMCWTLKRNYLQALRQFTRAAAFSPRDARYRANMAVALSMLGRYEEAKSLYEQVIPVSDAQFNLDILATARKKFEPPRAERPPTRTLIPCAAVSLTDADYATSPPPVPDRAARVRGGSNRGWTLPVSVRSN